MKVRCPDCGEPIEVTAGTQSGDLLECPNCAGHTLRVREEEMRHNTRAVLWVIVVVLLLPQLALAATSTVVLTVDKVT